MADACERSAWNHTFAIVAQIHNYHRDPKKSEAIDWRQYCPHLRQEKPKRAPPPTPEQRALLRELFPGERR
jgi:hypothetical protein